MDDEGEVHGGGVDASVQHTLGEVQSGDAGLLFQPLQGEDELVHAQAGSGGLKARAGEAALHVIGVEDSSLG